MAFLRYVDASGRRALGRLAESDILLTEAYEGSLDPSVPEGHEAAYAAVYRFTRRAEGTVMACIGSDDWAGDVLAAWADAVTQR